MITFRSNTMECSLPNAELNNEKASVQAVDLKRALDGTVYTYVKTSNRELLNIVITMSLHKAIEFQEFLENSLNQRMLLIDTASGGTWRGWILTNPVEFSSSSRSHAWPGDEAISVQLEFEGVPL